ncbi:MAG: trehalase family glycosidase [Planctomycetota bacterium]|nr:trehalase family glycosidase [Planctomycetota bacterium]
MAAAKKSKTAKRTTKARATSSRSRASQKSGAQLPKKIALSGGGYCLYAPRFPRFLAEPGFCDEANIASELVSSVFFLSFLANGRPVTTSCTAFGMEDGKAVLTHQGPGLKVVERRYLTGDDRFVCDLELTNESKEEAELTVVQWTTTDVEGEPVSHEGDSFRIRRALSAGGRPAVPTDVLDSSPDSKGARCLQAYFCEGGSDLPDYRETPWFDAAGLQTPRAKRPVEKPSPIIPGSRCYAGLFRHVTLKAGGSAAHRFEANYVFKGKGVNFRARRPDPKDENGYKSFWAQTPTFVCEDKAMERVVNHRFELLYLLRQPHGAGLFSSPGFCEGNGHLHVPSSFAAPAIMREARWLQDPSYARGCMKMFFDNLLHNGQVPGRVYMSGTDSSDFYHADWGGGFEALDAMHNDKATKKAVLMAMQRYVKWVGNNRDPEGSGLTDIVNHFESGQEFSRRYTVIDNKADRAEEFTEQFRLKGIDASVFRYRLVKWLHAVAEEIQEKAMANRFQAEVEVILDTVRRKMWDEKSGMFMDLDPKSRRKTNVKAAVGFYPLATDIPNQKQVDAMVDLISSRDEFWARYPVPSIAMSDSTFDGSGRWKGTRKGSPWNGRTWPVVNSHILEGLTYWAERGNKKAQRLSNQLLDRTITMMSGELEGLEQATAYEHYHPEHGIGSRYRGVDVNLNAFMLDNIFRIGCGFAIRYGEVQDDPIGDPRDFKLKGMPLGNKLFDVERKSGKLKISPQ